MPRIDQVFSVAFDVDGPLGRSVAWLNSNCREPRASVGAPEPGWTTAAALAEQGSTLLAEFLDYQTWFQSGVDRRTQASYSIVELSRLLSVAASVPLLHGSIVPDFGPAAFAYRFEDYRTELRGRDVVMKRPMVRFLSEAFAARAENAEAWPGAELLPDRAALRDRFRLTLEAHFAPLITTLADITRLSPAAQWRLVGDSVSAVFLDIGRRLGCEELAKADALAILKAPGSPLNNAQLHYFELSIALADGAPAIKRTFRSRGGCCRYYLTEGGHLCTTCVLEKPAERDRRLLEGIRKRFGKPAPT